MVVRGGFALRANNARAKDARLAARRDVRRRVGRPLDVARLRVADRRIDALLGGDRAADLGDEQVDLVIIIIIIVIIVTAQISETSRSTSSSL